MYFSIKEIKIPTVYFYVLILLKVYIYSNQLFKKMHREIIPTSTNVILTKIIFFYPI